MGCFVILSIKFMTSFSILVFALLSFSFVLKLKVDGNWIFSRSIQPNQRLQQYQRRFATFDLTVKTTINKFSNQALTNVTSYNNETKIILLLTSLHNNRKWFFKQLDKVGSKPVVLKNCPSALARNCLVTNDKRLFRNSAAVVVHPRDMADIRDLSRTSRLLPSQRVVFFSFESPLHTYAANYPFGVIPSGDYYNLHRFVDTVNWTMTYRKDSDIVIPYGRWSKRAGVKSSDHQLLSHFKNKTKAIAWVVSNCETSSKREEYVKELSKYIDVDIFGRCGSEECTCTERSILLDSGLELCDECNKHIESVYYFYLSFENSICQQYVTEKLFVPLSRGKIVPIVLSKSTPGGQKIPDYKQEAPPHSVIDTADFPQGPRQLADYLQHLIASPLEYQKYFHWQQEHVVEDLFTGLKWQESGFCELCQKLNSQSVPPNWYENIGKWWLGGTEDRTSLPENEDIANQCLVK